MKTLTVVLNLLREAVARKWFIAIAVSITLVLVVIGFALKLDVVDGALAATRFFGDDLGGDIKSADVALRPIFRAASLIVFYGGCILGMLVCSGFAPEMLNEGRIEHLLSLPVRKVELLGGTFIGVLVLAAAGALYGTAGLTAILGMKTGVWTTRLIFAGFLGVSAFGAIYMAMLCATLFVRSAPLSIAVGIVIFVCSLLAGFRTELAAGIEPGPWRHLFEVALAPFPRIHLIAVIAASTAASETVSLWNATRLLLGQGIFTISVFALGVWRFEQRDF